MSASDFFLPGVISGAVVGCLFGIALGQWCASEEYHKRCLRDTEVIAVEHALPELAKRKLKYEVCR